MNQYERIVSYIHQYQEGIKGANVGYAKVEKRGDSCRIQVQMRNNFVSRAPQMYLFKQLDRTIHAVPVGEMSVKGTEIFYKGSTEVDRLFGSELSLEEIDGLLIYLNRDFYFATSWKNDRISLGNWRQDKKEKMISESSAVSEVQREADSNEEQEAEKIVDRKGREKEEVSAGDAKIIESNYPKEEVLSGEMRREGQKKTEDRENVVEETEDSKSKEDIIKNVPEERAVHEREAAVDEKGEVEAAEASQVQMQAICGVCPFKRQNMDYGKRILLSFPTMRPFPEERTSECVRLELQDIGCLPMKYWSLSGNRFLLHGYYCYRHLIFCQKEQGKYVLGVPGIYSEREQKNACRFGFSSFQSIGEFGKQRGAFGYWLMELM